MGHRQRYEEFIFKTLKGFTSFQKEKKKEKEEKTNKKEEN